VLFMRTGFVRVIKLLQKDFSVLSFHIKYRFLWEPFSKEWVQFLEVWALYSALEAEKIYLN